MDRSGSISLPGVGFLVLLLTYIYVPYGDALLALVLFIFVLSEAAEAIFRLFRRLGKPRWKT